MLNRALSFLAQASETRKDWARIPLMQAAIHFMLGDPEMELKCFMEVLDLGEHNPAVIERAFQLLGQTQQYREIDRRIVQLEKEKVPFSTEMYLFGKSAKQGGDYDRALDLAKKASGSESKTYREQMWLGQILSDIGIRAKTKV